MAGLLAQRPDLCPAGRHEDPRSLKATEVKNPVDRMGFERDEDVFFAQ
jgi:hypothetical protein